MNFLHRPDVMQLIGLAMLYSYLLLVDRVFTSTAARRKALYDTAADEKLATLLVTALVCRIFGKSGALAIGIAIVFDLSALFACLMPIPIFWAIVPYARRTKFVPAGQ